MLCKDTDDCREAPWINLCFAAAFAAESKKEKGSTLKIRDEKKSWDNSPHPVTETSGSLNLGHCAVPRLASRTSSAESSAPMVAWVLGVINNIMFCNYLLCVPPLPKGTELRLMGVILQVYRAATVTKSLRLTQLCYCFKRKKLQAQKYSSPWSSWLYIKKIPQIENRCVPRVCIYIVAYVRGVIKM